MFVYQIRQQTRPTSLMRGSKSASGVTVEVLVEQYVITKVRIGLKLGVSTQDRSFAIRTAKTKSYEPPRDFLGDLPER